jgi:hypothetical protein
MSIVSQSDRQFANSAGTGVNLGDEVPKAASEAQRTSDYLRMNLEWKGLQNFSTTSKKCLTDLSRFGLTPKV